MKSFSKYCFTLGLLLTTSSLPANQVKQFILNPEIVYTIKTCYNKGVTTIMFPSAINGGLYGANVTRSPGENNADFLIDYSNGNYYFSIRALRKHATGSLNIVYNRRIYILKLIESSPKEGEKETSENVPFGSVTFVSANNSSRANSGRKGVAPEKLLSLIDQAKAYKLLKEVQPQVMDNVMLYTPGSPHVFNYKTFSVELKQAFRFNREDTIVFKLELTNKTDHEITYNPQLMAARAGQTIYYASITDASGAIPAQSTVAAYFGITGTPTGGRNELSPENDWTILITTYDMTEKKVTLSAEAKLYEQIEKLYDLDDPDMILQKSDELQKQLEQLKKNN